MPGEFVWEDERLNVELKIFKKGSLGEVVKKQARQRRAL